MRTTRFKLFILAVLLLSAVSLCAMAWAEDSEPIEPLDGMWKGVIVRKDRATLSFYDGSRQVKTFIGQDKAVTKDLNSYNKIIRTTKGSDVGAAGSTSKRIYAMSSAAGYAPRDVKLEEAFYGTDTLKDVPTAIVCNVYTTVLSASDEGSGDDTAIWMELTDANGRVGKPVKLSLPKPAYLFRFYADVSKRWTKSERSVNLDISAHDWDGDGYTDWVVSYVAGDGGDYESKVVTAYVDGKSLYKSTSSGSPTIFKTETECGYKENVAGGKTDVVPAISSRMAIGDVDGDGRPEVGIYYTKAGMSRVGKPYHEKGDNGFRLFKIGVGATSFESMYNSNDGSKFGNSYLKNDVTGIGMGDIDGDGKAEIVLLHGNSEVLYAQSRVYMDIWKWNDGMERIAKELEVNDYKTYDVLEERHSYNTGANGEGFSIGSYEVAVDDLDGDGRAELIWATVCTRSGTHYLRVRVHTWPAAASNLGSYDATDITTEIDANYSNYNIATGVFQDPTEVLNGTNLAKQVAIAWQNKADLHWGVYSYDKSSRKLSEIGKGVMKSALYAAANKDSAETNSDQVRPQIVAADFAGDSLVLGEPTRIDATDNIELQYVMAAPPVHWDVLDDGYKADAFFGLTGYSTKFDSSQTDQFIEQTTQVDSGSWGVGGTLTKNQTMMLTKQTSPVYQIGINYSGSAASTNTSSTTYQTQMVIATDAHGDDQVFFSARNYTIWRYPVLYPATDRYETVSNDKGEDVTSQRYMQFVVPVPPSMSASATGEGTGQGWSTAGSAIDWYEPPYDNHNIFTYPKNFSDMYGYPNADNNTDPSDPWRDVNGSLLYRSALMVVGNTAPTSAALTTTKVDSETDIDNISHKVGASGFRNILWSSYNIFDKPGGKLLSIKSKNIRLDANGDYSYQKTTTSTSSATSLESVKLNWPGAIGYKNTANLGPEDVRFKSQAAIYTQDSGALVVGYTVPTLKDNNTVLWGSDSPYNELPDPGLLLPFRYDTSDGSPSKSVYKSHRVRGVVFAAPQDEEGGYASLAISGLPVEVFVCGMKAEGMLRVYNYSFKPSGKVTLSVSYQKISTQDEVPDITKATVVDTVDISRIPGREENDNNWRETFFKWTVPGERQLGYLHFKVDYDGEQLSTDNDRGFVLVGCAPAEDFAALESLNTASTDGMRTAAALPNLSIESVTMTDSEGREIHNANEVADGEIINVICTVAMTPNGSGRKAVPAVRLFLLSDRSVLASAQFPLLEANQKHDFEFSFPKMPGTLRLLASSPFLRAADDPNPADNVYVLNPASDGGSGGGGCATGAGALCLVLLALAANRRRRHR